MAMKRDEWRRERQLWNEVQMDTIYARRYDEQWGGYINPSHQQFIEKFMAFLPAGSHILDAACGTGKYWPILLAHGFAVEGADQSRMMLDQASKKHPDVPTRHSRLQELDYHDAFDGVICMDAMEVVFPEDWPPVLQHFHEALHSSGHLYFTVEMASDEELAIAYAAGLRLGLPLLHGEYAHHGGYHYYPTDEQVRGWLSTAGFTLLDYGAGDDYRHYLTRRA